MRETKDSRAVTPPHSTYVQLSRLIIQCDARVTHTTRRRLNLPVSRMEIRGRVDFSVVARISAPHIPDERLTLPLREPIRSCGV